MLVGGTAGGFAGATVDTQELVEVAPVHLYEVNKLRPTLQLDYLTRSDLEERTLRLVRQENPTINFLCQRFPMATVTAWARPHNQAGGRTRM